MEQHTTRKTMHHKWLFLTSIYILTELFGCNFYNSDNFNNKEFNSWALGPFIRVDSINPILKASINESFTDPIIKQPILWQEKDVFNPAAIVKDGKVYLLYRAEDKIGIFNGTSRIGLAKSSDGLHFIKNPEPIFYPDEDSMKIFEWPGGCEDPRIVESPEGDYIMTYTAYEGITARLCIAVSKDLVHWDKKGLAFKQQAEARNFRNTWSKSGSIVCRMSGNKMIAVKIKGKYWMYWGDTDIFLASSENLIQWSPLMDSIGNIKPILQPRNGYFDSDLVEPGPPALLAKKGILLIYNGRNSNEAGNKMIQKGTYSAGQALFNESDPAQLIKRLDNSFFAPERNYEITGQINNVCFLEGLVLFKGLYYLYYGTADSKVAVAVCKNKKGFLE